MNAGSWFWILMVIWFVFGMWSGYSVPADQRFRYGGGTLLQFVLFFILGWGIFGSPLK